ncbi:MAG: hypothetical protein RIS47_1118 [Bacteroidota bacterium]|jgi:two-component system LytT family response regulator
MNSRLDAFNLNRCTSLDISEILYIKAAGRYTEVITAAKRYLICKHLKQIESELVIFPVFLRCHQSFLVNTEWIEQVRGTIIKLKCGKELTISRRKKKLFLDILDSTRSEIE